jgi:hypothetical protein
VPSFPTPLTPWSPSSTRSQAIVPIRQQVSEIYKDIGFKEVWNGIGARIILVGTLTGLQWSIYDSFKVSVGLQASGGK